MSHHNGYLLQHSRSSRWSYDISFSMNSICCVASCLNEYLHPCKRASQHAPHCHVPWQVPSDFPPCCFPFEIPCLIFTSVQDCFSVLKLLVLKWHTLVPAAAFPIIVIVLGVFCVRASPLWFAERTTVPFGLNSMHARRALLHVPNTTLQERSSCWAHFWLDDSSLRARACHARLQVNLKESKPWFGPCRPHLAPMGWHC